MELSTEDKQRIEQEVRKLYYEWEQDNSTIFFLLVRVAEYATLYERESWIKQCEILITQRNEMTELSKKEINRLEAERSELIEKMTELLKAFNDSDKNYADWVATKELYSAFTGVNNLLERLTK